MELDSHSHTSTWPAYGFFSPGFSQEKALYNGKVIGDISNTYLHIHQVMQDNTNDQAPIHFLSSTFVNSGSFWAYCKPTTMIKTVYNLDITKNYIHKNKLNRTSTTMSIYRNKPSKLYRSSYTNVNYWHSYRCTMQHSPLQDKYERSWSLSWSAHNGPKLDQIGDGSLVPLCWAKSIPLLMVILHKFELLI